MTVGDLYTKFGYAMKDISDVGSIWFTWVNILNHFFYRQIQNIEPDRFLVEADYSGAGTYDLPIDFQNLNMGDAGIYFVNTDGTLGDRLLPGNRTSSYKSYRLTSSSIVLQNTATADTFKMVYIPSISELSELTDALVLDVEWVDTNIEQLKRLYEEWDKNGTQETNADSRLNRTLSELVDNYKRTPKVATL